MTEDAQMKIRLPRDLKERIETAATAANRSWNGEIVQRLEASFQDEPKKSGGLSFIKAAKQSVTAALEAELADVKSQLQALRKQVGEIETRTQHLLPGKRR